MEEAWIYSTVDECIVFVLAKSKKPYTKMLLKETSAELIDALNVNLLEKKPGRVKDWFNRESLRFSSQDQAEEFMLLVYPSSEESHPSLG